MQIVNRNRAQIINTPHKSEIRPLVDRTTSDITRCSLAEEILSAGAAVGRHYHVETEEIYYILEGRGCMTIGSETRDVEAGDAIYIPRLRAHTLENTGDAPMRLLLICGAAHTFDDHFPGDPPQNASSAVRTSTE